jgi:hypothetical protein
MRTRSIETVAVTAIVSISALILVLEILLSVNISVVGVVTRTEVTTVVDTQLTGDPTRYGGYALDVID